MGGPDLELRYCVRIIIQSGNTKHEVIAAIAACDKMSAAI